MSGSIERIRARAQARADARREGVAELLGQALPGVRVTFEGDAVRLSGRRLRRRWDAIDADSLLRSQIR